MKYVALTGGLGNQLFIYAFSIALRKLGHKVVLFKPYTDKSKAYGHQGYELKKLFNVQEYNGFFSYILTNILYLYFYLLKLFPKSKRQNIFNLIGVHEVRVPENFIYYPEVFSFKHKNELYRGTWQSEKYFEIAIDEVRKSLLFNEHILSYETRNMQMRIRNCNCVSIHIRRGD